MQIFKSLSYLQKQNKKKVLKLKEGTLHIYIFVKNFIFLLAHFVHFYFLIYFN